MKAIGIFFCMIFSVWINAQKEERLWENTAVKLGYDYLGRNSISLGIAYNWSLNAHDWHGYNFGASLRYFKGEDEGNYIIPEIELTSRNSGILLGFQVSTKHVAPLVGFSYSNVMQVYTGYIFPYNRKQTYLHGMIFGLGLYIGLFGDFFYDKFNLGF